MCIASGALSTHASCLQCIVNVSACCLPQAVLIRLSCCSGQKTNKTMQGKTHQHTQRDTQDKTRHNKARQGKTGATHDQDGTDTEVWIEMNTRPGLRLIMVARAAIAETRLITGALVRAKPMANIKSRTKPTD